MANGLDIFMVITGMRYINKWYFRVMAVGFSRSTYYAKKIAKYILYSAVGLASIIIIFTLYLNFYNRINIIIRNYLPIDLVIQKISINKDKTTYNVDINLSEKNNRAFSSNGFNFNYLGYFKKITLIGYTNKPFSQTCEFKKIDRYCVYVIAIDTEEKISCYCDDTRDFK